MNKIKKRINMDMEICFCSDYEELYKYRFSYIPETHKIELPLNHNKQINDTLFFWIIDSISHEYLHKIIHEFENYVATVQLDNLGYNILTACNHKDNGDY